MGPAYLNISDELCKDSIQGIVADDKTKTDYYKIIQQFYKRNSTQI
ncbi:MAG: hypothetical protein L3J35_13555 [Bacteroidales bacterium]|nr:hypothetical protein [Bacteroidales bacterium]